MQSAALIREEWQNNTMNDMEESLNRYGKYAMLRPTGFGKTYLSAMATNMPDIINKKVVFVYVSEILRITFDNYTRTYIDKNGRKHKPVIKNGDKRIKYETYTSVAMHWQDDEYLQELFDGVGLIIFDEMQRMGAINTMKGIDNALKYINSHNIKIIGASATPERSTGMDVCYKYFTHPEKNKLTYCWGEHIYTLNNAFEYGLLQRPLYKYIDEDKDKIKKYRHTRQSMLDELKVEYAEETSEENKEKIIADIKELERAVIKNCDKQLLDGIYELVDEENPYIKNESVKDIPEKIEKPKKFPEYMRFMVFAPDRASLSEKRITDKQEFGGLVKETLRDFKRAFGRFGYKIRFIIVSSYNKQETENVKLIDPKDNVIKIGNKVVNIQDEEDVVIQEKPMTIDLIFSINMLNVGYHVNNITGLVLKRWTGSNQIYYQQIGRCLSSDSDNKAIIFDFVKSIDNRGINAPMFNNYEENKDTTINADGTSLNTYHNIDRKRKKLDSEDKNKYLIDANGDLVDPQKCNTFDSKYIKCSLTNADIKYLASRLNVYADKKFSRNLFNKSYEFYQQKFDRNAANNISLSSSLMLTIKEQNSKLKDKIISINFRDYLLWCIEYHKDLYCKADDLYIYLKMKSLKIIDEEGTELNSLIAASSHNGCTLNIFYTEKDLDKKDFIEQELIKKDIKYVNNFAPESTELVG